MNYSWISQLSVNGAPVWYDILHATLRTSLLFAIALLVTRYWRQSSAAQRHLVLSVTFLAALLVPIVQVVTPDWNVPMLPASAITERSSQANIPVAISTTAAIPGISPSMSSPGAAQDGVVNHSQSLWTAVGTIIWMLGVLAILAGLYRSHRYVRKVIQATAPVTHVKVLDMVERVKQKIDYTRSISVRYHSINIPIAYGRKAPVILLPLDAESWDRDRLHDVLVHECAHLKRGDSVVQQMVAFACALYWFNPLVWIAARQLRNEREQACDNYVIAFGRRPTDYATLLLDFTSQLSLTRGVVAPMLAFTNSKTIYRRLHAIIDPNRKRSKSTWVYRATLSVVIAGTTFVVSAFSPTARAQLTPSLLRVESSSSTRDRWISVVDSLSEESLKKPLPVATEADESRTKAGVSQERDSSAQGTKIPPGALLVIDGLPEHQNALRPRTSSVKAIRFFYLKSEEAIKKYGPAAKYGAIELTTFSVDEADESPLGTVSDLLKGRAPDGTKADSSNKLKHLQK